MSKAFGKSNVKGVDDSIRVLHVTEAYGGGIQTAIAAYVTNSPSGFKHAVIARGRDGHETHADVGCEVRRVNGGLLAFFAAVTKEIARFNPSVVHLHSSYAGVYRVVAPLGTRLVYTPHAYSFLRLDLSRLSRVTYLLVEVALARRPQTIAAISPFEFRLSSRIAGPGTKVHYLPNVASNDGVTAYRSSASLGGTRDIDIITVGRIAAQKDPSFIAKVAAVLGDGYRWVWVGDGDEVAKAELLQSGVEVTGWLPNDSVIELIREAKLYVHGAAWEGAPVTLLESVLSGTPVITRTVPSLAGLGFPAGGVTAAEVAKSVRMFFEDTTHRDRIVAACAVSLVVHSSDVQKRSLELLYKATSKQRGH